MHFPLVLFVTLIFNLSDRLQGELQVRGAGEVCGPARHIHAAAGRGVLEVSRGDHYNAINILRIVGCNWE